ncbi:MAG TPA: T9SS type A sorting domain-containing protein [Edaphocola sp.]|nr:T9SS type A sorting domain-containing protein [Edaphocola sp.]
MLLKKAKIITLLFLISICHFEYVTAQSHTGGIPITDARIQQWAASCYVERGWINIADKNLGKTTSGTEQNAIGAVGPSKTISLGDSGVAVLSFNPPIKNIAGPDFAVFENGFIDLMDTSKAFLEFAFVEVSSDGINFVRFPTLYSGQQTSQLDTFDVTLGKYYHNLAGNYIYGYGTPFDLKELEDSTNIDINNISHIRIVDVIGSIDSAIGSKDAIGNLINDPFPTPFPNGGFDLAGIGVLSEPTAIYNSKKFSNDIQLFPNPAQHYIKIKGVGIGNLTYEIININGTIIKNETIKNGQDIDVSMLSKGLYICTVRYNNKKCMKFFIKE